jgi:hypothetical protein
LSAHGLSEAVFIHRLDYPESDLYTLKDVANTLLAHEKIIKLVGQVLEKSVDGIEVRRIQIRLDKVEMGSLKEAFFVALITVYQTDLQNGMPELIEALTGTAVPDRYKSVVTLLVLVILIYGAQYIVQRLSKKKNGDDSPPAPAIQGSYNTYISLTARTLNITDDRLSEAVADVASKNKRPLTRATIDLLRPAKRGGGTRITSPGLPEIPAEAIAEFPSEAALVDLEDDTETEVFQGAILEIRAMDKDKRAQGWAGILQADGLDAMERRASVSLMPTVDAVLLATCSRALIDAMVEIKAIDGGERAVSRIHVLRFVRCLRAADPAPP